MKAEAILMDDRVGLEAEMVCRKVRLMNTACLAGLLDNPIIAPSILVIDCRPFTSYNTCHIVSARNAYCPPILLRRKSRPTSYLSLDFIVRDSGISAKLLAGKYSNIVLYDEDGLSSSVFEISESKKLTVNSIMLNSSTKNNSHLNLVLVSLFKELPDELTEQVYCLNGGFREFVSSCPANLLASQNLPSLAPPGALPGSLLCDRDSSPPVEGPRLALAPIPQHRGSTMCRVRSANDICRLATVKTEEGGWMKDQLQSVLSTDTVRYHSSKDRGDPAEVLPWLYIGNAFHASQERRLADMGITALLNVAEVDELNGSLPAPSSPGQEALNGQTSSNRSQNSAVLGSANDLKQEKQRFCTEGYQIRSAVPFRHLSIPIVDSATADISGKFPDAINFIESVRQSGGRCLVHCRAGISRSATICMAYLMKHLRFSLDDAHDFLKQRRRLISPNLNFLRQLSEYEASLRSAADEELQKRNERVPVVEQQQQQLIPQQQQLELIQQQQQHLVGSLDVKAAVTNIESVDEKSKNSSLSLCRSIVKQSSPVSITTRPFVHSSVTTSLTSSESSSCSLSVEERSLVSDISSNTAADTSSSQTPNRIANLFKLRNVLSSIPTIQVTESVEKLNTDEFITDSLLGGIQIVQSYRNTELVSNSRKRCHPSTTELCITQFTCSPKSSVAAALPTKAARFTFDFPVISSLASSPVICQSPLLSPS